MQLTHNSRIFSRLILSLAFPVLRPAAKRGQQESERFLFVHGSWRNLKRAGPHFSIFSLLRVIVVVIVCVTFLVFFIDQNLSRSNRIEALKRAVITKPSDFHKRLQLALLYEEAFKKTNNVQLLEKAQEETRAAIGLDPASLPANKLLMRLKLSSSKNLDGEISELEQVLKKRPDYQAAWLKLAILYEEIGDDKSAAAAFAKAESLNQNF